MKNTGLLCLFWMGLLIPMKAQITITNAVFPAVGDTQHYVVDNQPNGIVMTPPGGSQQWDFTNLHPVFTWQQIFQDAQAGADYGSFPSATLFYQTTVLGQEVFRQTSTEASGKLEELLDIANLEKGVYVCKISNGSGQMGQALFMKQ